MKSYNNFIKKHNTRQKVNHIIIFLLYFLLLVFFSLLFLGLTGCKKKMLDFTKYAKTGQEAAWSLPVVHGSLQIADIINDSLHIYSDDDGEVSLIYDGEVSSTMFLQKINIPDFNNSNDFSFDMPDYVPIGDSVYVPYTQNIIFNLLPEQRIKTLKFKSCKLLLSFNTDLNKDATILITIPDAIKNGKSYTTTLHYYYTRNNINTIYKNIDLSGYEVKFIHQGNIYNMMKITAEIYVYSNTEPNNSPYVFHISEKLSDISIEKFTGYAGQIPFSIYTDTISIDLFNKHIGGAIQFVNPKVRLTAISSVGAPASISFNSIEALFNNPQHEPIILTGQGLPDKWYINYPDSEGNTAISTLELNSSNSNIKDLLNSTPDKIAVSVSGMLNPDAIIEDNFINDSSSISLLTEVELPLYGSARHLEMQDDYNFKFEKTRNIQKAEFNIVFLNAFPIDVKFQFYFMDEQNNILDSLFSNSELVKRGQFDMNTLRITQPGKSILISNFDNDKMNGIKYKTDKIRIKAQLNTPENTPVKIYDDNYLNFNIGVKYQK